MHKSAENESVFFIFFTSFDMYIQKGASILLTVRRLFNGRRIEKMKKKIKQKIKKTLDMPAEIIMNSPKIVLDSDSNAWVENYTGIIEYSDKEVKLNTADFIVKITGEGLLMDFITNEDLSISGKITSVVYE